jgi:hypothetical protein
MLNRGRGQSSFIELPPRRPLPSVHHTVTLGRNRLSNLIRPHLSHFLHDSLAETFNRWGAKTVASVIQPETLSLFTISLPASAMITMQPSQVVSTPFSASQTPVWSMLLAAREPLLLDLDRDRALCCLETPDWHRQTETRGALYSPMLIADPVSEVLSFDNARRIVHHA